VYRTIIIHNIATAAIVLCIAGFLSAKPDTDSSVSDSMHRIAGDRAAVEQQESLAVEMLLKDLDITVDDTSAGGTSASVNNESIKNGLNKKSKSKSGKHVSKNSLLSIGKRHENMIPKGHNYRKYTLFSLILLFTALTGLGTAVYLHWQRDRRRFLTAARLSIMDKEVQNACNYIEKNFADPNLTLTSICNALVTGEAFLQALFQRELGITVENLISQVRVNRMKRIISKNNTIDMSSLAEMCGFADENALKDVFRAVTETELDTFVNQG